MLHTLKTRHERSRPLVGGGFGSGILRIWEQGDLTNIRRRSSSCCQHSFEGHSVCLAEQWLSADYCPVIHGHRLPQTVTFCAHNHWSNNVIVGKHQSAFRSLMRELAPYTALPWVPGYQRSEYWYRGQSYVSVHYRSFGDRRPHLYLHWLQSRSIPVQHVRLIASNDVQHMELSGSLSQVLSRLQTRTGWTRWASPCW